ILDVMGEYLTGVFRESTLCHALSHNTLNVPPQEPLQGCTLPVAYMLVADEAFSLKEYIQKPFSESGLTKEKRIYNYRLSRARQVVENAFGILANRFCVSMTSINLAPEKVERIVLASCLLHNYLQSNPSSSAIYTPPGSLDSEHPLPHE
uniref:DDE Tnp4 domain-containing protein n=1 Tax=Amphimedon queenslandica TaxID=400682 RepID=A0A1X7SZW5_AMPQE